MSGGSESRRARWIRTSVVIDPELYSMFKLVAKPLGLTLSRLVNEAMASMIDWRVKAMYRRLAEGRRTAVYRMISERMRKEVGDDFIIAVCTGCGEPSVFDFVYEPMLGRVGYFCWKCGRKFDPESADEYDTNHIPAAKYVKIKELMSGGASWDEAVRVAHESLAREERAEERGDEGAEGDSSWIDEVISKRKHLY